MAAGLAFASVAIAQGPVVREGTTVKVSPNVYVIPDELIATVPNVGIVVGAKGTLVVDPGMGLRSGQVVWRETQKVSKGGELYIVNTHFHPEHTTGEIAFPASAKIVRAVAQQQDIDELGMQWVSTFSGRSPAFAELLKEVKGFRAPAETFEREKMLDLGGVRVRLMWLGPGHTRGDAVVYVEEDGVLFSGDLAMKNLFPAFATPQSRSRSWIDALDKLEALRPVRVIGAHGELADASIIGAYRGFLTTVRTRVAELKRQGRSAEQAVDVLRAELPPKYPGWAQPIRILAAVNRIYMEQ
jgi:glyoxylase-like metal-dependent hydrolase (beta-lactamase superfamily II)